MRFMLSAMRHVIGSLFVVLSSLALRGCGEDQASMVMMTFGTTEWVWPTEERATDYIPEYEVRVPSAAVDCKVKLFGFDGQITDGGEAAYFEVTADVESKVACLKRKLPEGTFENLENAEWEQILRNREEHPHF